jgi:hypothetical protein
MLLHACAPANAACSLLLSLYLSNLSGMMRADYGCDALNGDTKVTMAGLYTFLQS